MSRSFRGEGVIPHDFMFQLTTEEYRSLRRQFGTLKRGAHSKYPPMAFTEQGAATPPIDNNRQLTINHRQRSQKRIGYWINK